MGHFATLAVAIKKKGERKYDSMVRGTESVSSILRFGEDRDGDPGSLSSRMEERWH